MDDCLIIGGGVIGLSLAYELAGNGLQVQVLDRSNMGQEASWAGAGMLPPESQVRSSPAIQQMVNLSNRLHAQWSETLLETTGIDNGYRQCGAIYYHDNSNELQASKQLEKEWQSSQIKFQSLTKAKLLALEPALASEKLKASDQNSTIAYHLPDEAQVRNPWHLRALISGCQQRGVKLTTGVLAHHLETRNGSVESVSTSRGKITAGTYCFAAGAWSSSLLRELDIHLTVQPVRGQIVLLNCQRRMLRKTVSRGKQYLVARDDGRILIGSTEDHTGFFKSNTNTGISELLQFATQLCPELDNADIERCWSGLRPCTHDNKPYLGRLTDFQNAFIATGHFRSGLQLSTGTAVVMRQLICGEEPEIALDEFQAERHSAIRETIKV